MNAGNRRTNRRPGQTQGEHWTPTSTVVTRNTRGAQTLGDVGQLVTLRVHRRNGINRSFHQAPFVLHGKPNTQALEELQETRQAAAALCKCSRRSCIP